MRHLSADVLIVGSGLAGLSAAVKIAGESLGRHKSARILIVRDGEGASPWVHGINMPLYPGDSPEIFFRDTLSSGAGAADTALARALCYDAGDCFNELCGMGLEFNREGEGYQLLKPLGSTYPRVASIGNETGAVIMEKYREILSACDTVDYITGRALRLKKEDGRVRGALIYLTKEKKWLTVSSKAVILACGGFCGIYAFSTNKRDSGGDGVAMAYDAGCPVTGMEFIQFEPSAAVWPKALIGTSVITTLYYEGAVLRDKDGRRFMADYDPVNAERVNKDLQSRRMAEVMAQGRAGEHGGVYFDATSVDPAILKSKYPMYVRRYADVGIDITKEMMEVAPAPHTSLGGVAATADGRTDVPGLYACGEVVGGMHGANRLGGSGGLAALVFGRRAGLACAADLAGGLGRDDKVSGTDGVGSCGLERENDRSTAGPGRADGVGGGDLEREGNRDTAGGFGLDEAHGGLGQDEYRDAPEASREESDDTAADWDKWANSYTKPEGSEADYGAMRREMGEALQRGAGVLRDEGGLKRAIRKLTDLKDKAENLGGDAYQRLRLLNDLATALLVCEGALGREKSLGCHVRVD